MPLINTCLQSLSFLDCFTQGDLEERKEVKKKIEAVVLECEDCQKEKNEAGENNGNKTTEDKKEDENMSDDIKKKDEKPMLVNQEPE